MCMPDCVYFEEQGSPVLNIYHDICQWPKMQGPKKTYDSDVEIIWFSLIKNESEDTSKFGYSNLLQNSRTGRLQHMHFMSRFVREAESDIITIEKISS
jgi:hypothetical protein